MEKEAMKCPVCSKEISPLDAHMGYINGILEVFHIHCWNKMLKLRKSKANDERIG